MSNSTPPGLELANRPEVLAATLRFKGQGGCLSANPRKTNSEKQKGQGAGRGRLRLSLQLYAYSRTPRNVLTRAFPHQIIKAGSALAFFKVVTEEAAQDLHSVGPFYRLKQARVRLRQRSLVLGAPGEKNQSREPPPYTPPTAGAWAHRARCGACPAAPG